jgi:hypothetical protein
MHTIRLQAPVFAVTRAFDLITNRLETNLNDKSSVYQLGAEKKLAFDRVALY